MPVIVNSNKDLVYNALGLVLAASMSPDRRVTVMLTILVVSMIAVSFPAVSSTGFVRIPNVLFFIGKHFGTGVILATAFIHLLPDSFSSLLDRGVQEKYGKVGNWVGLIILGSLLTIFLVEYVSTTFVDHLHAEPSAPPSPQEASVALPTTASPLMQEPSAMLPFLANTPKIIRLRSNVACICQNGVCVCIPEPPVPESEEDRHDHPKNHQMEKRRIGRRRQIVSIFVLQAGIMIHSLVIGLTLSIASGTDFASLTTAIIFHQIFEGLSLGVRIAALPPAKSEAEDEDSEDRHGSSAPSVSELDGLSPLVHPNMLIEGSSHLDLPHGAGGSSSDDAPSTPALSQKTPLKSCSSSRRSSFRTEGDPKGWGRVFGRSGNHGHYGTIQPGRESRRRKSWLQSFNPLKTTLLLLFAVTTPAGMALGLGLWGQGTAEPASMKLVQGVMSAISAGMLIYAATVEMIAGDFVFGDLEGHHHHGGGHEHEHDVHEHDRDPGHAHGHNHEHLGLPQEQQEHHHHHDLNHHPSIGKRVVAVTSLLSGVAAMTLIGLWD